VTSTARPHVCVIGAALIDLITYVPRLPMLGETLHGREFRTGFGGKGANQAVMAARLGANVTMVTRVGNDSFGTGMIENFRAHGIDTTHVGVDLEASSGVAPIAVAPDGANAIVIVTAANENLTAEDVERACGAIEEADVVVCQLELPHEASAAALRIAREAATTTILNPAPASLDLPRSVYALVDVLCPNEPEAELLLERPIRVGRELEAARELRALGSGSFVLTLGERGCAIAAERIEQHLRAPVVSAVDTTGAGDAFVGTLAYGLACGEDLATAAQRANRAAALSVTRPGTQTSFPSSDEVG
jgi:ribokinase